MKKSLLISFIIFWILTTAIITSALTKTDNKKINATGLNNAASQSAISNHLPVANAAGDSLDQADLDNAILNDGHSASKQTNSGSAQQRAYQAAISHPDNKTQKAAASNNNRGQAASPSVSSSSQLQTQAQLGSAAITSAQVAARNSASSCWSIIDGGVYDLTSLVSSHSGGAAAILGACGKDGTAIFNSHPHSGNANNTLDSYYIGELSSDAAAVAAIPDPVTPPPAAQPTPTPAPAPVPTPNNNNQGITSAQVAARNSATSCWSVINGNVYDLTSLVSSHSGGSAAILSACGKDGTAIFYSRAHSNYSTGALNAYYIGILSVASPPPPPAPTPPPPPPPPPIPTPTPTPPPPADNSSGITLAEVTTHNTASSCWSVINGKVYNLTSLVSSHSGGSAAILSACGIDGTSLFNSQGHSNYSAAALAAYYLGDLTSGAPASSPPPAPAPAPPPAPSPAPDPAPAPPPRERHHDDDDDD